MFCTNCLSEIKAVLRNDDIKVLRYLKEIGAYNPQRGIDRIDINTECNLTIARTSTSLHRLEASTLIGKNSWGRRHSYYLNDSGIEILKMLV